MRVVVYNSDSARQPHWTFEHQLSSLKDLTHKMAAPPTTALEDEANWAVDRATGLPEVWALVAVHLGLVGAWRLMRVCKAARVGMKEFLSTLPGLVVNERGVEAGSGDAAVGAHA
jgi:hypothetical protein